MGVFSDFLKTNNIPDSQLTGVSDNLERLTPEDRDILLKREKARKTEKKYDEVGATKKPRSGRGVTVQALEKARADKPLPRKVRSKIVSAINTILERRKQKKAKINDIFGAVTVATGKVVAKKK